MIKIANVCPIGNLERFGYKYNVKTIIKSHIDFFDAVIYVADCKNHNFYKFFDKLPPKVYLMSNRKTWANADGSERFDLRRIQENKDIGFEYFKKREFNFIMGVHINQYVPESSFEGLREQCNQLSISEQPFDWLYKKYQLADIVFNADRRLPWILNMNVYQPFQFWADAIKMKTVNDFRVIQASHWPEMNSRAIVDVLAEFTLEEGMEKHKYTVEELHRHKEKKYDGGFDKPMPTREQYLKMFLKKFSFKISRGEPMDKYGREIVANSKPEFLSHWYKEKLHL